MVNKMSIASCVHWTLSLIPFRVEVVHCTAEPDERIRPGWGFSLHWLNCFHPESLLFCVGTLNQQ